MIASTVSVSRTRVLVSVLYSSFTKRPHSTERPTATVDTDLHMARLVFLGGLAVQ